MLASRLPPHEYIRFKLASLSFIKFATFAAAVATAASGRFFFRFFCWSFASEWDGWRMNSTQRNSLVESNLFAFSGEVACVVQQQ